MVHTRAVANACHGYGVATEKVLVQEVGSEIAGRKPSKMVSSTGEPRLCPCCRIALEPRGRSGVNIDCCSQCHGVWLDRGELERIMERMYRNRVYRFDDEDAFENFDTMPATDGPRSR